MLLLQDMGAARQLQHYRTFMLAKNKSHTVPPFHHDIRQFNKERLDLDDYDKDGAWCLVFGTSSNRCMQNRNVFKYYRLFMAVAMTAIVFWSISGYLDCANGGFYWPIYLTHWTAFALMCYFWCAWYTTYKADDFQDKGDKPSVGPWYVHATWFLQAIVLPGAFFVTTLYWALVYPHRTEEPGTVTYFVHGVNFFMIALDVFLSNQPYYLVHGLYFFAYCITYLLWTLVYWAAGRLLRSGHSKATGDPAPRDGPARGY